MAKFSIEVNGKPLNVEAEPDMPLLWVLRDKLGLTGTKFGCGIGQCGACTVHLDGAPMRSCLLPISSIAGNAINTIEGLAGDEGLHPIQQVWADQDVAQCGYCQTGQIMSAAALLKENSNPSDDDIDAAMAGNFCRCGTYIRIRQAIHSAAKFYSTAAVGNDAAAGKDVPSGNSTSFYNAAKPDAAKSLQEKV